MGLHCQFHRKEPLILRFMEILTDLPLTIKEVVWDNIEN